MKLSHMFAASLLVAGAPARAAEPVVQTPAMDMRCYVMARTLSALAASHPKIKQRTEAWSMFYLGRVSTGLPDSEIETLAVTETEAVETEDATDLVVHCGTFVREREAKVTRGILQGLRKEAGNAEQMPSSLAPAAEPDAHPLGKEMLCHITTRDLALMGMPQTAQSWSIFYLGRISSQLPDAEMVDLAEAEARAFATGTFATRDIADLLAQCGAFVNKRGQETTQAIERGKKNGAAPAADAKK